jgi:integrase
MLKAGTGVRTVNRTIGILKIAFREGIYREQIIRNPTLGVDPIKYKSKEIGVFTAKELAAIFQKRPGVFSDIHAYAAFSLAASAGMRRGEILALTWRQIDFEKRSILIDQALKNTFEIGLPKWGRIRSTYLAEVARAALLELRAGSVWILPEYRIFIYDDGSARSWGWYRKAFERAMRAAGIDRVSRTISPHSFRHSALSLLRGAGQDPDRLRASFGWSDSAVMERYTHWQRDNFEEQRNFMNGILGH